MGEKKNDRLSRYPGTFMKDFSLSNEASQADTLNLSFSAFG